MANVPVRAIPIKTSVRHAARASQVAVPWLGFVGGGLMEGCARGGAGGDKLKFGWHAVMVLQL